MATFKVFLDKRRQLNDGTYPLIIRLYSGRKRRDINLKIHIKEAEFDDTTQRVNSKHPNKKVINQLISQSLIKAQETTLNLEIAQEVVTSEKIKNLVVKPHLRLDFISYGWQKVEELKQANHYGNSCIYRDALNCLINYTGKNSIQFREIDHNFLKQLENRMLFKEVKINTVALCLRTIRAIYNKAIKEKQVDKSYYPFDEFTITHQATAKRNISKEDIIAIAALQLAPDSQLWHSRNYFLLSFNLRGISFADMVTIKPEDITNGRLIYRRKKTHKLYNIKLTEKAQELLDIYGKPDRKYILPVIPDHLADNAAEERKYIQYGTKTCNKYLKRIGKDLKLPLELTTYVARHSFATVAKKMGFSKDLISEALGHSNGNRITEIYLDSFDQEVIDEMNEEVCKF